MKMRITSEFSFLTKLKYGKKSYRVIFPTVWFPILICGCISTCPHPFQIHKPTLTLQDTCEPFYDFCTECLLKRIGLLSSIHYVDRNIMESTSHQGVDLMSNSRASEGETSGELGTEECDDTSRSDSQLLSRNDRQLLEFSGDVGPSEPYIGMEFKSADDGREYYSAYARRNGFTIRVNRKRRSRIDRAVIGFDYVCSKEGFRPKSCLGEDRTILLSKQSRVGCKAILVIAYRREIEKWVVTNFVREHNHDLMGPSEVLVRRSSVKASTEDEKDKRIQELTAELYNERQRFQRRCSAYEERCAAYKVALGKILKDVELHSDHLTERVPGILQTIKEIEDEY